MFYSWYQKDRYDSDYVGIRERLDILCRKITGRELTSEEAHRQYRAIENEYALLEGSRVELFEMIYKNRIVRLCNQFLLGGA